MTQRLSIKHLQVLAAFRRTGSLSKIAEFLKLTPSAVSRRIDEAEARLGRALFVKASNRVRLTPAGEYILQVVVDDGSGESAGNFGYHCCWTNAQTKITVNGGSNDGAQH